MTTVVIDATSKPTLTVVCPQGGKLIDLCDDNNAPIPFGCRTANCGTCRIEVLEGQLELLPAEEDELDILDIFGMEPPRHRLACQAKIRPGAATLRIRPVDD